MIMKEEKKLDYLISISVLIFGILIGGALIYNAGLKSSDFKQKSANKNQIISVSDLEERVIPSNGMELPVKWGNLGKQLVETGVIDGKKFEKIYAARGELSEADKKLLYGDNNGNIVITRENSGIILNLLWALGLGNKNPILENGPMADPKYGGADRFASTAGWTLAKGETMDHYSRRQFIVLTAEQQSLVEKVSKNIYRPCCGNSVYFPDCNHGMAMLGILELAASQGINEKEMYKMAKIVNSYWFPDTYLTIAKYFVQKKGILWENADAREVLGFDYSSGSGYQNILSQVESPTTSGGGGCGV